MSSTRIDVTLKQRIGDVRYLPNNQTLTTDVTLKKHSDDVVCLPNKRKLWTGVTLNSPAMTSQFFRRARRPSGMTSR
ncbi:hypothetical protein BaRGS_00025590 [Batillaria attramentaria]|uniref:Uncharacterized protein n=1 Tax=Batillaria attramentaria TaxID=370345 RepID=A0ABD0K7Y4_9CAEN